MADAATSLPVRTQNPGDVIAKLADATTPSQQLAINASGQITSLLISNGAVNGGTAGTASDLVGGIYNAAALTLTTGQQASLQLNASGALIVTQSASSTMTVLQGTTPWVTKDQADGSATGGTAGAFSLLAGAIYNSTAPTLTTGQQASLQSDVNGNLKVDLATSLPAGTNAIGTVTVSNLPTTLDTNYGTVGASTLRTASQIGNATGAADFNNGATSAQTLRTAANLAVSGANVSTSNPVPVTITSATPGTPVQDYHTSATLAAGSSVTFTYTVAASHTFSLERMWASASGKIKAVLNNNGSPIMVGFNSTATPNIDMTIVAPPTVAAGNTVTVVITNDDILPFDVYATIEGNQN